MARKTSACRLCITLLKAFASGLRQRHKIVALSTGGEWGHRRWRSAQEPQGRNTAFDRNPGAWPVQTAASGGTGGNVRFRRAAGGDSPQGQRRTRVRGPAIAGGVGPGRPESWMGGPGPSGRSAGGRGSRSDTAGTLPRGRLRAAGDMSRPAANRAILGSGAGRSGNRPRNKPWPHVTPFRGLPKPSCIPGRTAGSRRRRSCVPAAPGTFPRRQSPGP